MPSENGVQLPESDIGEMNFRETELTLRLPGESSRPTILTENNSAKMGAKRGLDLSLDCSSSTEHGDNRDRDGQGNDASSMAMLPASKSQVVGWPPVRASRKQAVKSSKFIKVAVDGAPFLRKVDLEMYSSYQQLLSALEDMFSGLTIRKYMNEKNILDQGNAVEYVPTYEDKDGDWMMVGDVPWKMFVESCKRLRLMKSSESEAIELAPKTPSKCSSTC